MNKHQQMLWIFTFLGFRNHYLQCWKDRNYLQHSKGVTFKGLQSGHKYMTEINIYKVQSAVTAKAGK